MTGWLKALRRDLEAPVEERGFGTGWFAGFFALLLASAGFAMVLALRYPHCAQHTGADRNQGIIGLPACDQSDHSGILWAGADQPDAPAPKSHRV